MAQAHNCGKCEDSFDSQAKYLAHKCVTGFTPKDVEHQDALTGGQFSIQSAAALKRGADKAKK